MCILPPVRILNRLLIDTLNNELIKWICKVSLSVEVDVTLALAVSNRCILDTPGRVSSLFSLQMTHSLLQTGKGNAHLLLQMELFDSSTTNRLLFITIY